MVGFAIKAPIFAVAAVNGMFIGVVAGTISFVRFQQDTYRLSEQVQNKETLVEQDPISTISQKTLFVSEDHWAFDIRELVAWNRGREEIENPYTRCLFSQRDRAKVLRHSSGLGKGLLQIDLSRADAARHLSLETIQFLQTLRDKFMQAEESSIKEVALVDFLLARDNLSKQERARLDVVCTSAGGETIDKWLADINSPLGAKLNSYLEKTKVYSTTNPAYDLINQMACIEGFHFFLSRCLSYVEKQRQAD